MADADRPPLRIVRTDAVRPGNGREEAEARAGSLPVRDATPAEASHRIALETRALLVALGDDLEDHRKDHDHALRWLGSEVASARLGLAALHKALDLRMRIVAALIMALAVLLAVMAWLLWHPHATEGGAPGSVPERPPPESVSMAEMA